MALTWLCVTCIQTLRKLAGEQGCDVTVMSAQVEAELNELEEEEAREYLEALGAQEGGLRSLIRATYSQLGLRTYFTSGEQETRAWTFRDGMTAPGAPPALLSLFACPFHLTHVLVLLIRKLQRDDACMNAR